MLKTKRDCGLALMMNMSMNVKWQAGNELIKILTHPGSVTYTLQVYL